MSNKLKGILCAWLDFLPHLAFAIILGVKFSEIKKPPSSYQSMLEIYYAAESLMIVFIACAVFSLFGVLICRSKNSIVTTCILQIIAVVVGMCIWCFYAGMSLLTNQGLMCLGGLVCQVIVIGVAKSMSITEESIPFDPMSIPNVEPPKEFDPFEGPSVGKNTLGLPVKGEHGMSAGRYKEGSCPTFVSYNKKG